ncbi:MAG: GNAT family N-acetyltransferase [Anaerolineales bacterium]
MNIQAYTSSDAFDTLRDDWNPLLQASGRLNIFTTWEWQSNWWAAYHPGDLWILAMRTDAGELVGLAPWFIDHSSPNGPRVRSIGCVDVTDYLEPILHAEYIEPALEALAAYTAQQHAQFNMLDFCNIPASAPVLEHWPAILRQNGFDVDIQQQDVCPVIPLPGSWDDYLQQLNKKQRHEIRRKMRRLKGLGAEVTWAYITEQDDLSAALERFFALMRRSSAEKEQFLQNSAHVDFFRRVIPALQAGGWLKLSFLQLDGQDAAAYIAFDYDNRVLLYNSGHDPDIYPEVSPGIMLLSYIIEDAIDAGRSAFDFLRGDEEYKYRMGGQDQPVMFLSAQLTP